MNRNPLGMTAKEIASYSEQTLAIMEAVDKPQVHEDMVFCAPLNPNQVSVTEEL